MTPFRPSEKNHQQQSEWKVVAVKLLRKKEEIPETSSRGLSLQNQDKAETRYFLKCTEITREHSSVQNDIIGL